MAIVNQSGISNSQAVNLDDQSLSDSVKKFETKLNLPTGFYNGLRMEDDWSFVIKLSALFEGACSLILEDTIGKKEISSELRELDYANARFGKLKMLNSLEIINKKQKRALEELARLRNYCVHNVENTSIKFADLKIKKSNLAKDLIDAFSSGRGDLEFKDFRINRKQFVEENTKLAIWLECMDIFGCLYVSFELNKIKVETELLKIELEVRKSITLSTLSSTRDSIGLFGLTK